MIERAINCMATKVSSSLLQRLLITQVQVKSILPTVWNDGMKTDLNSVTNKSQLFIGKSTGAINLFVISIPQIKIEQLHSCYIT